MQRGDQEQLIIYQKIFTNMLIDFKQQKLQRTRTGSETCAPLGSPCEGVSEGGPQGRRLC